MGLDLRALRLPWPELDLAPPDWAAYVEHLAAAGVPEGLLAGVDPQPFQLLLARVDGETVGTALAFDHAGDCGVFNVFTLAPARRRGLGTALTARLLHDAAARGCRTASLQATPMAERLYAAAGFRDLGRFLEYAPSPAGCSG
jgi:GNAT superfamily N-acetyltransferase